MDFNQFKEEIIIGLGGNLIDVELEDPDINLAFEKAKRTFKQKGNNSFKRDFMKLKVQRCNMVYKLPSEIDTVVKVIKPTMTFNVNDEFSLAAYYELFGYKSHHEVGDYISYEYTLQSIEMWREYLAFDVQFHHDKFENTISFLQPPDRDNAVWLLEVYRNLSDDQYRDVLWIQSWALAEAKIMLGAAYRKFSQLPGPDGSVSLDGNSLIQEGQRDKEQLIEDINNGIDGDTYGSAWEIRLG